MSFEDEFQEWLVKIKPQLNKVFEILKTRLKDEPEELIQDLLDAESWNNRTNYLLAEANSFLDKAALYYLPGKDETIRELERKTMLDSSLAHIRKLRDQVEGMADALKQRLILGESILSYKKNFIDPTIKQKIS